MERSEAVDEYIARFPPETQRVLQQMRELLHAHAPGASETISYGIPTLDLNGRHLVHFAGYPRHIGFYPIPTGIEAFREELSRFKQGRGSVQFPLGEPLPAELIGRIVDFRVAENVGRGSPAGGRTAKSGTTSRKRRSE